MIIGMPVVLTGDDWHQVVLTGDDCHAGGPHR